MSIYFRTALRIAVWVAIILVPGSFVAIALWLAVRRFWGTRSSYKEAA